MQSDKIKRLVKIASYNPKWPQMFENEVALLKSALGDNLIEIHHIGSTSIPNLSAKPVIDMIAVVTDLSKVDQVTNEVQALGYEDKGEFWIPFRRFFQKNYLQKHDDNVTYLIPTHHLHIFEQENPEIDHHLKFRNFMRENKNARDLYEKLKRQLAKEFPDDINSYCQGKDNFITDIDNQAGFKGLRMLMALTNTQWESIINLRQKNFFDDLKIIDPYKWSFNHQDHIHFVLYCGTIIIGYAHIQLWPENRAAMRIIVIDELYRNQNYGSHLLLLCEKWLKNKNYKSLHVESSIKAQSFYLKHSYKLSPFNDPDNYQGDPNDIAMAKII